MQAVPVSLLHPTSRVRARTALVASADRSFRQRIAEILTGLRWQVREVEGGAQTWTEAELATPEAVIVDSWLPDLDLNEFLTDFRGRFPQVDLVTASGTAADDGPRGPYRQELLYALRRSQDTDTAVWNAAPALNKVSAPRSGPTTINGNAIHVDKWTPGEASEPLALAPGEKDDSIDSGIEENSASCLSPYGTEAERASPGTDTEANPAELPTTGLQPTELRTPKFSGKLPVSQ